MSLKLNIISNYLGNGWTTLMGIAFVPIYIKYMGLEAYGLIGAFTMLQIILSLLDVGMTPTLNREMARFTGGAHNNQSIHELLFSVEIICIVFASIIALSMVALSGFLASSWFQANKLPIATMRTAIMLMGLVAAFRFVESIYRGALLGLQEHVWLNFIVSLMATLRGVGVIGILIWISPTIEAFFFWQALVSLVTITILGFKVHRSLPPAENTVSFSRPALLNVWSFARGMIATTFLSIVLTQMDKVLLSRFLTLEAFGTYSLAVTVANALILLIGPVAQGYYPRFTELHTQGNEKGLIEAYHQGSQLMTSTVVPAALIIIFHGELLIKIWSGNQDLAKTVAPIIAVLVTGTALNGLMNIPYMLQLSYGWSSFTAKVNLVLVVILFPIYFWIIPRYGAIGAAWIWVGVNFTYIFIVIHLMHRKLLPKEKWIWYRKDFIVPAIFSISAYLLITHVVPLTGNKIVDVLLIALYGVLMMCISMLVAPDIRRALIKQLTNILLKVNAKHVE